MFKKLLPLAFVCCAIGCNGDGGDEFDSPFQGTYIGTAEVLDDDSEDVSDVEIVIEADGDIFGILSDEDGDAEIRGEVDENGEYTLTLRGEELTLEDEGVFVFEEGGTLIGLGTFELGGETFRTRYELDEE